MSVSFSFWFYDSLLAYLFSLALKYSHALQKFQCFSNCSPRAADENKLFELGITLGKMCVAPLSIFHCLPWFVLFVILRFGAWTHDLWEYSDLCKNSFELTRRKPDIISFSLPKTCNYCKGFWNLTQLRGFESWWFSSPVATWTHFTSLLKLNTIKSLKFQSFKCTLWAGCCVFFFVFLLFHHKTVIAIMKWNLVGAGRCWRLLPFVE